MEAFSSNLSLLRKAWNLSQAEMAKKFGVTPGSFNRWENGTHPNIETIIEIAKFFKIPVDDLLTKELTHADIPPRWRKPKEPKPMTFDEQVRKELKGLNRKQIATFAWLCAVRALPFLGSKGHFDFWGKEDRQKHLISIFNAIDLAYLADAFAFADEAADIVADAYAAAEAADEAAYEAAYAAAEAEAAAEAAAYAEAVEAYSLNSKIPQQLIKDIEAIKSGRSVQGFISDYAEIWGNFQSALSKEGCSYWGRVYQELFENNFKVGEEELLRRQWVPQEIKSQGAAAVGDYLEKLGKDAKRLNEARIIILGDKGAGKTCVARRLKDPNADMTTDEESTAGVDTTHWELKQDNMKVNIWDFAGHTVTHAVHQFFLSERCLYIMVYDGRTEERNRLEYWLGHMKNYGGNSKAIILVNERDHHAVNLPINFLKEQFPIAGFYYFNVKNDTEAMEQFRKKVADYILHNPSWENQKIPKSYYQVKEELEKRFNKKTKGQEHITKVEFEKIAQSFEVEDSYRLLSDLHALGISLWYKDMDECQTLILNPEWISQGVYKIINWVSGQKTHEIRVEQFSEVFEKDLERFPKDKHPFLFNLLKYYELAFETKEGNRLIIPHLLNEDQPAVLPTFGAADSLQMKYEADMPLPPNTISRFIVRHNEQIKQESPHHWLVWKFGVILDDKKGSLALVREIDRTISVSVKGQEKTAFISQLRATLNDIFSTYKSKQPELTYRLVDGNAVLPELYLPEAEIATLQQLNKPYFDYRTGSNIPMGQTVIHYNITHHTTQYFIKDAKTVLVGGEGHQITETNFNFHDCNLALQGNLEELATKLFKAGKIEDAEELTEAVEALKQIKAGTDKDEVKNKGAIQALKRISKDLGDKDSTLYKTVEGLRRGKEIAQDIAEGYNGIAEWLGLPQVPKLFLKKKE